MPTRIERIIRGVRRDLPRLAGSGRPEFGR
jgi:hypothetical protein